MSGDGLPRRQKRSCRRILCAVRSVQTLRIHSVRMRGQFGRKIAACRMYSRNGQTVS
ncbi:hypothetical protein GGTG_11511 [Gaeumannomyces tritici R3-111a-1]|uniref:Uncharacterized protein n=1 Tax=Gaeumannomyces tritici (strain R3-111a-1) TaxID=644352 RepID=J3PDE3_GAET3|nr:hypothetical protein GGTG_11511 [Gaeumannomyces tritici R3-111a-1]EJT70488.1 hypothetical protein GGTG_11511 [Gaeumannomyces tritici R3-111a-1]